MNEYHKIQSVYKRDPATNNRNFLLGDWSIPEFGYLAGNSWEFTEKVDGTNIRVMIVDGMPVFAGKTDAATIPEPLRTALDKHFVPLSGDPLHEVFSDDACLYGEGYGAKIQKGGGNYRPDQDFVLFDVRIGQRWLTRESVHEIAGKLGIAAVPIIGTGTLYDMIYKVHAGFKSQWGDFMAEGIVARPAVELFARNGDRIITKAKHKDFV